MGDLLRASALAIVIAAAACSTPRGSSPTSGTPCEPYGRFAAIDKIDLLFMIDNSPSMGDKQLLLSLAVPELLSRLLAPNCVDGAGNSVGVSAGGKCPDGTRLEFPPVHDLHIGIVSSSLGGRGSDACSPDTTNPASPALNAHDDDAAHLLNRAGADEHAVSDAKPASFLAWLPPVSIAPENMGKPAPPVPALSDPAALISDFSDLARGTHEHGCDFEAQLESWYRFLIQPDPYATIARSGDVAVLNGIDAELLKQRHDFLRADSLVAIIMLTDENTSTVDPLGFGGHGWYFEQSTPHVKPGTQICATNPTDAKCQSCYLMGTAGDPGCATPLDDSTDNLNVRFFKPRERFGYDPRFPIERYVKGLTARHVPDRFGEHPPGNGFNYVGEANCSNPLFSTNLPTDPNADLCHLTPGPRTPELVFFAVIGGVPWQLLTEDPTNLTAANKAPFKAALNADDWTRILGKDPAGYDMTGIDSHMLESITPRPGVGTDDAHTREWNTKTGDLQYACTFALPTPKDCLAPENAGACDCTGTTDSPLCDPATKTTQLLGKAYPTIQELQIAKAVGAQAIVTSLCPRETADPTSIDYGYRPAMRALVDRMKDALSNRCLPEALSTDATGQVPCVILETLAPSAGVTQVNACDALKGLTQPDPARLTKFLEGQEALNGDAGAAERGPVCELTQLATSDLVNGSCEGSSNPGWCYVTGAAAGTCAHLITYSKSGLPSVATKVSLQCGSN